MRNKQPIETDLPKLSSERALFHFIVRLWCWQFVYNVQASISPLPKQKKKAPNFALHLSVRRDLSKIESHCFCCRSSRVQLSRSSEEERRETRHRKKNLKLLERFDLIGPKLDRLKLNKYLGTPQQRLRGPSPSQRTVWRTAPLPQLQALVYSSETWLITKELNF